MYVESQVQSERSKLIGGDLKRSFDLVIGLVALILLSPLLLTIYLSIILLDGRPAIIRHTRLGACGMLFSCLKFRTMVVNAEEVLAEHLLRDDAVRDEWEATFKLKNDPRITRIGAFLRKTSLDELPQLFNVIMGDMSLVGPRPITAVEGRRYEVALFSYIKARPGITGLWQISGRNDVSYPERVKLDKAYIANWSFKKDIVILAKTPLCVITADGSY